MVPISPPVHRLCDAVYYKCGIAETVAIATVCLRMSPVFIDINQSLTAANSVWITALRPDTAISSNGFGKLTPMRMKPVCFQDTLSCQALGCHLCSS